MKLTKAERNPDIGLVTQQTFPLDPTMMTVSIASGREQP